MAPGTGRPARPRGRPPAAVRQAVERFDEYLSDEDIAPRTSRAPRQPQAVLGEEDVDWPCENRQDIEQVVEEGEKTMKCPKLIDPEILGKYTHVLSKCTSSMEASFILPRMSKFYGNQVDRLHEGVMQVHNNLVSAIPDPETSPGTKRGRKQRIVEESTSCAPTFFDGTMDGDEDVLNFEIPEEEHEHEVGNDVYEEEEEGDAGNVTATVGVPGVSIADKTIVPGIRAFDTTIAQEANMEASFSEAMGNSSDRRKMKLLMASRAVLLMNNKRSVRSLETRFSKSDNMCLRVSAENRLRKGFIGKSSKKDKPVDDSTLQTVDRFGQLILPLFSHADKAKYDRRHVTFDDVAVTAADCTVVALHEGMLDPEKLPSLDERQHNNSLADDVNLDDGLIDLESDPTSAALLQLAGAFEVGSTQFVDVNDEWLADFNLNDHAKRHHRNHENYVNVSFFDTTDPGVNGIFDENPPPEDDAAFEEERDRYRKLIHDFWTGREKIQECVVNPDEQTIYLEMGAPPHRPIFDDEDLFFPFDLQEHVTPEILAEQVKDVANEAKKEFSSISKHLIPPESSEDPSWFVLGSIMNQEATTSQLTTMQQAKELFQWVLPFRMVNYAEQMARAVVMMIGRDDLPQKLNLTSSMSTTASSYRAVSTAPSRLGSPAKMRRLAARVESEADELFFVGREARPLRYQRQQIHPANPSKLIDTAISALKAASDARRLDAETRKAYTIDAFFALVHAIGFFADNEELFSEFRDLRKHRTVSFDELPDILGGSGLTESRSQTAIGFSSPGLPGDEADNTLVAPMEAESSVNDTPMPPEIDDVPDDDFHSVVNEPINVDAPPEEENVFGASENVFGSSDAELAAAFSQSNNFNEPPENGFPDQDFPGDKTLTEDVGALDEIPPSPPLQIQRDDELNQVLTQLRQIESESRPISVVDGSKDATQARKIVLVEDNSHWMDAGTEKPPTRQRKQKSVVDDQPKDVRLFMPRDAFTRINDRRRSSRFTISETSDEHRAWFLTLLESVEPLQCAKIGMLKFKIIDLYSNMVIGHDDRRPFVSLPYIPVLNRFNTIDFCCRGKYQNLPKMADTKQAEQLRFMTFCIQVFAMYHKASLERRRRSGSRSVPEEMFFDAPMAPDDVLDDDDNFAAGGGGGYEGIGADFDDEPLIQLDNRIDAACFSETQENLYDEMDDELAYDEYDFYSPFNRQSEPLKFFRLKRAIRYILKRPRFGQIEISDMTLVPTSTPAAGKQKVNRFGSPDVVATGGGMFGQSRELLDSSIPIGDEDVIDDDDDVLEDETDETQVPNFEVKGRHTLKSVLSHLPFYCHPETAKILSYRHVFMIVLHMANENELVIENVDDDAYSDIKISSAGNSGVIIDPDDEAVIDGRVTPDNAAPYDEDEEEEG